MRGLPLYGDRETPTMCMLLAFIVRHEAMKGNLKKTPTCENATQRGPYSTAALYRSIVVYLAYS